MCLIIISSSRRCIKQSMLIEILKELKKTKGIFSAKMQCWKENVVEEIGGRLRIRRKLADISSSMSIHNFFIVFFFL
jgi:hypothetical protein